MNFLLLITLFKQTESTLATSFLWVVYAIPAILVGPIAAAYVDMADRRKILMISNLLQALTIFIFAYSGSTQYYILLSVALMYSFFNQFYVPAEFASLPSLVKKREYPLANGLFFLTQQSAVIIGFAIAGLLAGQLGFTNTLYLCSFFLLVAFLSVLKLPPLPVKDSVKGGFTELVGKFFENIKEGYFFIKGKHSVFVPFVLLMALQIVTAIIVITAPVIATDVLGSVADSAGILVAVPAGIGALIGAIIVSKLLVSKWRKITSIKFFLSVITIVSLVLVYLAPAFEQPFRISIGFVAIALAGMSFVGVFIPLQTFLQEEVPGGLRGRVFGNFWFLVTIATIIPVILSGVITDALGVQAIYTILAGLAFLGVVLIRKHADEFIARGFKLRK